MPASQLVKAQADSDTQERNLPRRILPKSADDQSVEREHDQMNVVWMLRSDPPKRIQSQSENDSCMPSMCHRSIDRLHLRNWLCCLLEHLTSHTTRIYKMTTIEDEMVVVVKFLAQQLWIHYLDYR